MGTLDKWQRYLAPALKIDCPTVVLAGRERGIATGRGQVLLESPDDFKFIMLAGPPGDPAYAHTEVVRLRKLPQDARGQPRLEVLGSDDVEWSCHYVLPWHYEKHGSWTFGGEVVTPAERMSFAAEPVASRNSSAARDKMAA